MRADEPSPLPPDRFEKLPIPAAEGGGPRRVGVEVEFTGLSAQAAATALARELGGLAKREDAHAYALRGTTLGDLKVELDLRHAHPQRRNVGMSLRLGARAAALFGSLMSPFAPRELITEPLEPARLPEIDAAIAVLRRAGATGRGAVLLESLGLHFNVDPPSLRAETLSAYLKAYLSLEARLRRATARRSARLAAVLPPAFPSDYGRFVLDPGYWPDLARFTADYLSANPTRRRGLDLLPVLLRLDEPRVRAALPREKIGRRAVLHYRLPLAHPGDPAWGLAPEWNRWIEVERHAATLLLAREG
jgi:hypothetical protein